MKKLLLFQVWMFASIAGWGQVDSIDFSLLSQYDKVNPIVRNTPYLKLKSVPFSNRNHFLGFGGGYRFQTEGFLNEQFNRDESDQTDLWYLNRFMLHGSYKYKNNLHAFVELSSATIESKENVTPVDQDSLAVNQMFITLQNDQWQVLIGRQNMRLGSGRLVDIREGPNVRLSFDMIQLHYSKKKWDARILYAIPVQQEPGVFDNNLLHGDEYFAGAYATHFNSKTFNSDLYVLHKLERDKAWDAGVGDDDRTSIGSRLFGNWKGFIYDFEAVYQLGRFNGGDIHAYTASLKVFREVEVGKKTLDVGLKTEFISGDRDPDDNTLNTFDALYPRGAYFGRVARFGPSNIIDIHPWIASKFKSVEVSLDYVAFWRYSTNDGLYNPSLILDYPSLNDERFVGHQIGTITGWEVSKYIFLELESNVIFPGRFLIESGLEDVLVHAVLTAEFRF